MNDLKIRVYVVDDHPLVREGLTRALSEAEAFLVVGAAASATEALAQVAELEPAVVVLDLGLPDMDGIELVSALRAATPNSRILVLSSDDHVDHVVEALRAGAQAYLLKTSRADEVADAIRRVVAGESPLSPRISSAVVHAMRKAPGQGVLDTLTTRERQVLRHLASGLSTRETAARLTISPKTVETHRVHIYSKLGCKSVADLARIAVRTGLIDP